MTRRYNYPEYLGEGLKHWISFEGFAFNRGPGNGNPTIDIALYIPADALQTSYKSEYTSIALGQVSGRVLEGMKKVNNSFLEIARQDHAEIFKRMNWSVKILGIVLLCSILPFGPFYAERNYFNDTYIRGIV